MTAAPLSGWAAVPPTPSGAVLVVYCGSEARTDAVLLADLLHHSGLATLVVDVVPAEAHSPNYDERDEPSLVARRVRVGLEWLDADPRTHGLPIAGVADARAASGLLVACGREPSPLNAVACVGGQPDRAGAALQRVVAPVLLVAGAQGAAALAAAREAQRSLVYSELAVMEGTSAITGDAYYTAACRIRDWFLEHLTASVH